MIIFRLALFLAVFAVCIQEETKNESGIAEPKDAANDTVGESPTKPADKQPEGSTKGGNETGGSKEGDTESGGSKEGKKEGKEGKKEGKEGKKEGKEGKKEDKGGRNPKPKLNPDEVKAKIDLNQKTLAKMRTKISSSGKGSTALSFAEEMKKKSQSRQHVGCDLDDLPDTMSPDVKTKIDEILSTPDGPALIDLLVTITGKISSLCFNELLKDERINLTTTCTKTQATLGACNANGDKMKINFFYQNIGKTDNEQCEFLIALLENDDCERSHLIDMRKDRVELCGTEGMSMLGILAQPITSIQAIIKEMGDKDDRQTFLREMVNITADDPEILQIMPCAQKDYFTGLAVENFIDDAVSKSEKANGDEFWEEMAPLLPFMDSDACKGISFDKLLDKADILKNMDFFCSGKKKSKYESKKGKKSGGSMANDVDEEDKEKKIAYQKKKLSKLSKRLPKCSFSCGKHLIATLMDNREAATDDTKDIIDSLDNLKLCQSFDKLIDSAKPGECNGFSAEVLKSSAGKKSKKALMVLVRKCMPNDKIVKRMTQDDLKSMGCMAVGMDDLDEVDNEVLCDPDFLTGDIAKCMGAMSKNNKRIMKKCSSELKDMNATSLMKMGSAAVYAPSDMLKEMAKNMDEKSRSDFAKGIKDMKKGKAKAVAHDIVSVADPKDMLGHSEFAKALPLGKMEQVLENMTVTDLLEAVDTSGMQPSQTSTLLAKFMEEKGVDSLSDFDAADIPMMGSLPAAFPSSQLKDIEPEKAKDVLLELCRLDGFKGTQSDAIAEKLFFALTVENFTNPLDVLSEDMVWSMNGDCFKAFTTDHLSNATLNMRLAVCQRIGSHPRLYCIMDRSRRQQLAEQCIDDLTNAENSKALLADIKPSMIETMSAEQLLRTLPQMQPTICLSKSTRDVLKRRIEEVFEFSNMTDSEVVSKLGDFALLVYKDQQEEIAEELVTYANLDSGADSEDNKQCCLSEMNTEDKEAADEFKTELGEARFKLLVASSSKTNRRKRSVRGKRQASAGLTCAIIQAMEKLMLTVENVNAMDDLELEDCFDNQVFGSYMFFSNAVKAAILTNIERIKAQQPCDFDEDNVENLGSLADQLTTLEISCLPINNDTQLGMYHHYNEAQLQAYAARYLQIISKTTAEINADDIVYMGHFVCGLTASQISSIPFEVYGASSSLLGRLLWCPETALTALAQLAIKVFGEVESWTASHFSEAGSLIGGLTADELNTANVDAVEMWTPVGINLIPATVFTDVNAALLGHLSRLQAMSVTSEQIGALDSATQDLIEIAQASTTLATTASTTLSQASTSDSSTQINSTPMDNSNNDVTDTSASVVMNSMVSLLLVSSLLALRIH